MKQVTLTDQLNNIGKDIVSVLKKEGKPLTQGQLFAKTSLENISEFGWSFALSTLEKKRVVKFVGKDKWELTSTGQA